MARDSEHQPPDPALDDLGEQGGPRIRCPLCAWRPRATDRWQCQCGCQWNTFDTSGQCPDCGFRWPVTQCLACHEFSPHESWYSDSDENL